MANFRIATHSTNDGIDYYSVQKQNSDGVWIEAGTSSPHRELMEEDLYLMEQGII